MKVKYTVNVILNLRRVLMVLNFSTDFGKSQENIDKKSPKYFCFDEHFGRTSCNY